VCQLEAEINFSHHPTHRVSVHLNRLCRWI